MLAEKTAIVTGVTSGIGQALTEQLLALGMTVGGVGRPGDKLARTARLFGKGFEPLACDLADPRCRAELLTRISERFERIDVLVNNAAECVYALPLALAVERLRELLEVNLLAAVELTRGLRASLSGHGHIVNVSSVAACFLPNPRFSPYALTKAALDQFTEGVRLELERENVRVTLIRPGLVNTPIYDKVDDFGPTRAKIEQQLPRWLDAEDVAEAIVWALSRPAHVAVNEIVIAPRGQSR